MTLPLVFPFAYTNKLFVPRLAAPSLQAIPRPFEAIAGLVPSSGTKTRGPPHDQYIPAITHPVPTSVSRRPEPFV